MPSAAQSPRCPASAEQWATLRVIEGARLQPRERRGGSRGDEAVEQHGDAMAAGGERGAEDGGKLAAAEDHARGERVRVMGLVTGEPCVDDLALSRQAGIVEAGAAPGPTLAAAAEQRRGKRRGRGGVADAHLAEADEIGACRHRIVADRHSVDEFAPRSWPALP